MSLLGRLSELSKFVDEYLERHKTTKKFFKAMILSAIGFIISNQAEILASIPSSYSFVFVAFIFALENYIKHNSVGKKK